MIENKPMRTLAEYEPEISDMPILTELGRLQITVEGILEKAEIIYDRLFGKGPPLPFAVPGLRAANPGVECLVVETGELASHAFNILEQCSGGLGTRCLD